MNASARPTRSEVLIGGAFFAAGVAVISALISKGRTLGGAESQVGADQLQYLSWVVSSADHWTIDSLWSIPQQTGSRFLHPGFLASGLLNRVGVPIVASYQVWKLVAIPAVLAAAIAWTRRLLPAGGQRTAALALVLFGLSPVGAVIGWNQLAGGFRAQVEFAAGELFAPSWLWGYMMTALAVALMIGCLLLADPLRRSRWRDLLLIPAALACSWLQPWQGAELMAAVLAADLAFGEGSVGARLRQRLPFILAAAAPLAYYAWLGQTEEVWRLAGTANNSLRLWSPWVWMAALLPWFPALLAYRRRPGGWIDMVLLVMPPLMIGEYLLIAVSGSGTFPFHAIQGMGFFLGVLAVRGAVELRGASWWRARVGLGTALCLLMCVPGTLHRLNLMRLEIHKSVQPYFLETGEVQALSWLRAAPRRGGVLAPIKAGLTVPAHARRAVWVGELSWTPDFRQRVALAESLFRGELSESRAGRLIDSSGARFAYADCGHRGDPGAALAARAVRVERFGCARVWVLRPIAGGSG